MADRSRPPFLVLDVTIWSELAAADAKLLAEYETSWRDGISRTGRRLNCRQGCIPCCMGPFEVTPLDAVRLAVGLLEMGSTHPDRAALLGRRAMRLACEMAAAMEHRLPTGTLPSDQGEREGLLGEFSSTPCPAVSRRSGRCLLYAFRPLSCRSYGLPVMCGGETLPPCSLNLEGVPAAAWPHYAIEPDPADREGELLALIQILAPGSPDTTVAGALAAARKLLSA